jgi:hypothetical protein
MFRVIRHVTPIRTLKSFSLFLILFYHLRVDIKDFRFLKNHLIKFYIKFSSLPSIQKYLETAVAKINVLQRFIIYDLLRNHVPTFNQIKRNIYSLLHQNIFIHQRTENHIIHNVNSGIVKYLYLWFLHMNPNINII